MSGQRVREWIECTVELVTGGKDTHVVEKDSDVEVREDGFLFVRCKARTYRWLHYPAPLDRTAETEPTWCRGKRRTLIEYAAGQWVKVSVSTMVGREEEQTE